MSTLASVEESNLSLAEDIDTIWLLFGSLLVFLMQTGFAMLEVGWVEEKNTSNILLKNVCDASSGGLIWWLWGYGLAMGDAPSRFIGTDTFALVSPDLKDGTGYGYASWLFQWAFAATTATIVSGAVAERCTLTAYLVFTVCLTGFVYPVVVQMGWGGNGVFSAWLGSDEPSDYLFKCGVIDFAGSGVVHMTGGVSALVGASILGRRQSVVDGHVNVPPHGPIFQTLGTLVLWFGWYGFNAGSTLYLVGNGQIAAKIMVNTTIAAASGALGALLLGALLDSSDRLGGIRSRSSTASAAAIAMLGGGQDSGSPGVGDGGPSVTLSLEHVNNGVLSGLVAITAGCAVVEPYGACVTGLGAAAVYMCSSRWLASLGVDDVVDAVPVHGFCGCYGVVMASLLATKANYRAVYGIYDGAEDVCGGVFYGGQGNGLAAALLFVLFVCGWVGVCSGVVFSSLHALGVFRVAAAVEEEGLDFSAHGKQPLTSSTRNPFAHPSEFGPGSRESSFARSESGAQACDETSSSSSSSSSSTSSGSAGEPSPPPSPASSSPSQPSSPKDGGERRGSPPRRKKPLKSVLKKPPPRAPPPMSAADLELAALIARRKAEREGGGPSTELSGGGSSSTGTSLDRPAPSSSSSSSSSSSAAEVSSSPNSEQGSGATARVVPMTTTDSGADDETKSSTPSPPAQRRRSISFSDEPMIQIVPARKKSSFFGL